MIELTEAEEEQLFYELFHLMYHFMSARKPSEALFSKRYPTLYKVYSQLYTTERKNKAIWWVPPNERSHG